MSNESSHETNPLEDETKEQTPNGSEDIFYLDSVERIKLIGAISDCDTQTLLNAYIDILGIESLRPFLLTTFFKSIPIASPINRNKKKKVIVPPPLPQKLLNANHHTTKDNLTTLLRDINHIDTGTTNCKNGKNSHPPHTIKSIANAINKSTKKNTANGSKTKHNKITNHKAAKHRNGRNFASNNGSSNGHHNGNKLPHNGLQLHSTNQPLPSRTTPAVAHHLSSTNNRRNNHELSSHNNCNLATNVAMIAPLPPFVTMDNSEKEEEKSDHKEKEMTNSNHHNNELVAPAPQVVVVPAPAAKQTMQFNITMPIKVELLNRNRINKYFNLNGYPQDLHVFHGGELPDDLYMKIFSWLDFKTVLVSLKLVSRSWFHISSQSSSCGHFKCLLPVAAHHIEWDTFQFISKFEMYWSGEEGMDRWSDYNKVLSECVKINMRDVQELIIKFHDFSFYSFSKHPLKRLFKLQRNLRKIELNAMINWKEHDIADCLRLILDCDVVHTLKSFIIHNFIINPTRDELILLKQQIANDTAEEDVADDIGCNDDDDIVMLKSAKVLAEFLMKCDALEVFRWHYDHVHRKYTCYGIYVAFHMIYLKWLRTQQKYGRITDLHLPSFPQIPISFRRKERVLYDGIVNRLRLKRLRFKGDLSFIHWNTMAVISPQLEYLELNPSRSTNESFTKCFTSICGLKYLVINTIGLATTGYYQNDELSNFVTPYFRTKNLNQLQSIHINVKFLEEKSLFAFLLKCKYAISLRTLSINGQSFNGTLKNEDIRRYIGEFEGTQELHFILSIESQFYSSKRVLHVTRLSNHKGITIDKEEWKKKKKIKIKNHANNTIQQSLSMKLADIHNSGQPRFQ